MKLYTFERLNNTHDIRGYEVDKKEVKLTFLSGLETSGSTEQNGWRYSNILTEDKYALEKTWSLKGLIVSVIYSLIYRGATASHC